jgi:hypothetical protein
MGSKKRIRIKINSWPWLFVLASAMTEAALAQVTGDPAHINVYVTPFYNSKGPMVDVGPFSKGLAASKEPEFVATIVKMKQSWSELRFPKPTLPRFAVRSRFQE